MTDTPYCNVTLIVGAPVPLPGSLGDVQSLLQQGGPLIAATTSRGARIAINPLHVVSVEEVTEPHGRASF